MVTSVALDDVAPECAADGAVEADVDEERRAAAAGRDPQRGALEQFDGVAVEVSVDVGYVADLGHGQLVGSGHVGEVGCPGCEH